MDLESATGRACAFNCTSLHTPHACNPCFKRNVMAACMGASAADELRFLCMHACVIVQSCPSVTIPHAIRLERVYVKAPVVLLQVWEGIL